MPQLYWIIPLEGGHISNELYRAVLPVTSAIVRQGLIRAAILAIVRTGSGDWSPVDPGWGSGGGDHVGGGPIIPPVHVGGGPILNPEIGTPVPPDEFTPEIPPETISSQYLVSVYNPKTQTWTTKSYPPR